MKKIFSLVALAALGVSPAYSQGPPQRGGPPRMGMAGGPLLGGPVLQGDWWRNSAIASQLQISDAQRQQLEQIFTQHRSNLSSYRQEMQAAETTLKQSLDSDPVNDAAYNASVAMLQSARDKVALDFATMTLAFRKVLTAEQWKGLEDIEKQKFRMRRRPPGGTPPSQN